MSNPVLPLHQSHNIYFTKAKGCCLFDATGRKYLDFESGLWCMNLGYSIDRLTMVIAEQANHLVHHGAGFRNIWSEKLSHKLTDLLDFPGGGSVFLCSGSEAVNLAIQLAQHLTGRIKVLKLKDTYISAFSSGPNPAISDCLMDIDLLLENPLGNVDPDSICALVLETSSASHGLVRFPGSSILEDIVSMLQASGCLIIADEVTSGIGRTGYWWGYQHYTLKPDMVVCGKALGNGYPISAVTISGKLATALAEAPFLYVQSHQNDPLGCRIGLEVLNLIEEYDMVRNGRVTGGYFLKQLEQLADHYPDKIKEARGRGLMLALECGDNINAGLISRYLLDKGLVVGCKKNTLRFLPPLIIGKAEINLLVDIMDDLFRSTPGKSAYH